MNAVDLPSAMPASTDELIPPRTKLCQLLRDLTQLLTKRELELMDARETVEFAATIRKVAEELAAAAATWARTSDSIRCSGRL